jgi:hypothetical protein
MNVHASRQFPFKNILIVCIYFLLSLVGILHHEIWLDEAHHFLLARDSSSLCNLFFNARYDGHPLLWNVLLYVLTQFTHDVFYMQLFHVIISTTAVFVFVKYSPFGFIEKLCIIFGYFIFYEYNIISRNYALGLLFLFTICAVLSSGKRKYFILFTLLLLLANTHLFYLICSIPLFIISFNLFIKEKHSYKLIFLVVGVYFAAIVIAFIQIIPPSDHFLGHYNNAPYFSFARIGKAFSIPLKGFIHIPDVFKYNFWNTNLLVDISKPLSILLSLFFLLFSFIIFHDKPTSLIIFYFSALGIIFFIYISPIVAGVRYFGFIFMLFLISLWLSKTPRFSFTKPVLPAYSLFFSTMREKIFAPAFTIILATQLFSSAYAFYMDYKNPFSEAKNVVMYLMENNMTDNFILVSDHTTGPPISAYLGKKIYYPENNNYESFCLWNTYPFILTSAELNEKIQNLLEQQNIKKMVLILSHKFFMRADSKYKANFLKGFDHSIMKSENYYIYSIEKK